LIFLNLNFICCCWTSIPVEEQSGIGVHWRKGENFERRFAISKNYFYSEINCYLEMKDLIETSSLVFKLPTIYITKI